MRKFYHIPFSWLLIKDNYRKDIKNKWYKAICIEWFYWGKNIRLVEKTRTLDGYLATDKTLLKFK